MDTDNADVRTVNDVRSYFALPKEGGDREETKEFLRAQVRSSRCVYER